MSFTTLLVATTIFWLLVHLWCRYVLSSRSILPLTTSSPTQRAFPTLLKLGHYAEVVLPSRFVLRGETTTYVDRHAQLLEFLGTATSTSHADRRGARSACYRGWDWGVVIRAFYGLGTVTAIVGQLIAVGMLWWSLLRLGYLLVGNSTSSNLVTQNLVKRSPIPAMQSLDTTHEFFLRPLIPGVTLPMSHSLPILVSLIACTTVHELGHAIAAAADGVPLISWGYSLILVVPAAFVELAAPSVTGTERAPLLRLRISAAGAYHNLIALLVLFLVTTVSLEWSMWSLLGYRDIENGIVVVGVHENSPLRAHLIPGSIITGIDDVAIIKTSNQSNQDLWSSLLLTETVENEFSEGWCVDQSWFQDHSQGCCPSVSGHDAQHETGSCFFPQPSSLRTRYSGRCIDAVPLFEDRTKQRCVSDASCNSSRGRDSLINYNIHMSRESKAQICVAPHASAALLRISLTRGFGDINEKIVVWKGPKREVWEQVTVGKYLPRIWILPLALPSTVQLLLEYLKTVSLSLFFFNLLPVRFLDGGEFMNAFMELALTIGPSWENDGHGNVDLEMGRGRRDNHSLIWRRRARKFEIAAETMTVTLVGAVFTGGLLAIGVG